MKISVLPVSFFKELITGEMTLQECADIVAKSGAQGLDLTSLMIDPDNSAAIKHARTVISSAGLEIGMLVGYPDFTNPDSGIRANEQNKITRIIQAASELGAQFVRLTAGQAHPQTGLEQGIYWAVEGLSATMSAGQKHGVHLVFENHSKPGIWQFYDFAYPADVFLEIARRTAKIGLDILFDTANPVSRGENPLDILIQVIDRVKYIHASDTLNEGGGFTPVLLGAGAVPFNSIFKYLKQKGYDGWVAVEECSRMGSDGVNQAVTFLQNTWNDV